MNQLTPQTCNAVEKVGSKLMVCEKLLDHLRLQDDPWHEQGTVKWKDRRW